MPYILDQQRGEGCPVVHTKQIHSAVCPATIAQKPAQEIYPIMARLPSNEAHCEEVDFLEDYFIAEPGESISGTLEYDPQHEHVRYTRSRLPEIDEASRDLWVALHKLRAITNSYAGNFQCRSISHIKRQSANACPMQKSSSSALDLVRRVFNWETLRLPESTSGTFYGVVFRSKRSEGSDTEALMFADKRSHEEAVTSGGLLMYWYGVPDPQTGSNLATCIWRNREEARRASALPLHKKAAQLAGRAYDDFELSRYKVAKYAGETIVRIEEWD